MGPDVTCWGTFLVKTLPKFQDLIMNGIGRHRAYGYVMILLKQARSAGTLRTQSF